MDADRADRAAQGKSVRRQQLFPFLHAFTRSVLLNPRLHFHCDARTTKHVYVYKPVKTLIAAIPAHDIK